MESELSALEEKIDQFVRLCQQLRSENIQLRQQLASAISENKHQAKNKHRREQLLSFLPEPFWVRYPSVP